MDERDTDLPEGVIDADPAGGWESGATADGETAQRDADGTGEATLAAHEAADDRDAASGVLAPDGEASGEQERPADSFVESAEVQQGLDPDLVTDEQADR